MLGCAKICLWNAKMQLWEQRENLMELWIAWGRRLKRKGSSRSIKDSPCPSWVSRYTERATSDFGIHSRASYWRTKGTILYTWGGSWPRAPSLLRASSASLLILCGDGWWCRSELNERAGGIRTCASVFKRWFLMKVSGPCTEGPWPMYSEVREVPSCWSCMMSWSKDGPRMSRVDLNQWMSQNNWMKVRSDDLDWTSISSNYDDAS